jgi:hypothetical protein
MDIKLLLKNVLNASPNEGEARRQSQSIHNFVFGAHLKF